MTLLATLAGIVPPLFAATAFGLWKRPSAPLVRRIRILETAPLGPKRALILAEVNGIMMVIGASEAGIALLTAPAPATNDGAIPSNEAADDSTFDARATNHGLTQLGPLHAEGWTNATHRTTPEN
jgi:flagellar biogenesis protein FliO